MDGPPPMLDSVPMGDAGRDSAQGEKPDLGTWPLKFCHRLTDTAGGAIDVTIEIGSPPVRVTTRTGTCAPALGVMCPLLSAGSNPFTLYQGTKVLYINTYVGTPNATQVLAFIYDQDTPAPDDIAQVMGLFNPSIKCESINPVETVGR